MNISIRRAYIAAPIFTETQLSVVEGMIAAVKHNAGLDVFSPYHASRPIWDGRSPAEAGEAARRAVLRGNVMNLHWADLVVAWLGGTADGRTDTGVVYELGYAGALSQVPATELNHGTRRPFTLGYIDPYDKRQGADVNLMLAGTLDAVVRGEQNLAMAALMLGEGQVQQVVSQFNIERLISHEQAITGGGGTTQITRERRTHTGTHSDYRYCFNGVPLDETELWGELPEDVRASRHLITVLDAAQGQALNRNTVNMIVSYTRQLEAGENFEGRKMF